MSMIKDTTPKNENPIRRPKNPPSDPIRLAVSCMRTSFLIILKDDLGSIFMMITFCGFFILKFSSSFTNALNSTSVAGREHSIVSFAFCINPYAILFSSGVMHSGILELGKIELRTKGIQSMELSFCKKSWNMSGKDAISLLIKNL